MDMSIAALRLRYADREICPVEMMDRALARIGDPDQASVWISTITPEAGRAAAERLAARLADMADLPLYGALFSVKDNIDVAGEPTSAACPAYSHVARDTATVVARAIAAGALYLGKTNMDQFATGLVGVRSPHGTPRNPFNPDAIPGGSSSGAGVSVSTGIVSFAFGTDTGGSGRVPASYNGIFGLKPAPGDWSRHGLVYACRSFDTPSVFAAALDDVRAVDAVVRGHDPKDAFSAPERRETAQVPRLGAPVEIETFGDRQVRALWAALRRALPGCADVDLAPFQAINDLMFFGPFLAERDVSVGEFIDSHWTECDPVVRDLVVSSRGFTAADAHRASYRCAEARRDTAHVWQACDVIVTPTVGAITTLDMCRADPLGPNFNNGFYTNFANPLGLASVSVPVARAAGGTPWGVTLYAPPARFPTLMAAARIVAASAKTMSMDRDRADACR